MEPGFRLPVVLPVKASFSPQARPGLRLPCTWGGSPVLAGGSGLPRLCPRRGQRLLPLQCPQGPAPRPPGECPPGNPTRHVHPPFQV